MAAAPYFLADPAGSPSTYAGQLYGIPDVLAPSKLPAGAGVATSDAVAAASTVATDAMACTGGADQLGIDLSCLTYGTKPDLDFGDKTGPIILVALAALIFLR